MKNESLKNIDATVVGQKINDIIFGDMSDRQRIEEFLMRLPYEGGSIVSSSACLNEEILVAKEENRFLVINSFGFVLRKPA